MQSAQQEYDDEADVELSDLQANLHTPGEANLMKLPPNRDAVASGHYYSGCLLPLQFPRT